jgi:uncharacterized membrane protein
MPGPSLWSDYAFLYLPQLKYLASGLLLYRDFAYSYTPMFLYSMLPFYELGGGYAAWIPIVVADALTAPVVYLIVRRFSTEKVALIAGLGYAFSPVALANEGYLWMSSQPMTLFLLLSILLLKKDRQVLSAFVLAIAVLFKQEAVLVLPVYLIFWDLKSRKSLPTAAGVFVLTVLAGLSPFLIQAPKAVLNHIFYWLPFSIGKSEPALAPTPYIGSLAQTCVSATVPSYHIGAICGNLVNFPALSWYAQIGTVNAVAGFVAPFLLLLFAVGLIAIRHSPTFFQMACAYACIAGFFVFGTLVHGVFGYYFIPVYALILSCVTNGRSLLVALVALTLALFAPEGPFQYIIPVTCIFTLAMIQDSSRRNLEP